jgi:hypothetical protein
MLQVGATGVEVEDRMPDIKYSGRVRGIKQMGSKVLIHTTRSFVTVRAA